MMADIGCVIAPATRPMRRMDPGLCRADEPEGKHPAMNTPARTSTPAIVSLVFGILSWVALPIIGAIVAIVAGHMARREIRDSIGVIQGDGMAIVGLLLGYLHVLVVVAGLALVFLVFGGIAALALWAH
jgi:hypothetical protein